MLIKPEDCCLLLIDVQERLIPAIFDPEPVIRHCLTLVKSAKRLSVPLLATEQYPKGLGGTDACLAKLIEPGSILPKELFSGYGEETIRERIDDTGREQVVVCGMEAHVCVLQTVLDLAEAGYQVFVVADACGSRAEESHRLAMERMRDNGAEIVTTEMVVFEWLERANTEDFRALIGLLK